MTTPPCLSTEQLKWEDKGDTPGKTHDQQLSIYESHLCQYDQTKLRELMCFGDQNFNTNARKPVALFTTNSLITFCQT